MMYLIAGLKISVSGNCNLEPQDITFEKSAETKIYKRKSVSFSSENALSSGEKSSPDEMCLSVGSTNKNEITVRVGKYRNVDENGNSRYVLHRMAHYAMAQSEGAACDVLVPDFAIQYKICTRIDKPIGASLGNMRGFGFYKNENTGISVVKEIEQIEEILARIDIENEFSKAKISLFDVSDFGGFSLDDRIHSYLGEAFAYLALMHDRVIFHASAISYKGKGLCFSAPSGTGKSTHTGLWKTYYGENTEIINDDTPVLYKKKNQSMLCGSPWSGKTELNKNKEVPLCAIVFLEQSPKNFIYRLTGLAAVKRVFSEVKIPQIPELFSKGIETVSSILSITPVYCLGCTISKEAVDLVKDTLELQ